MKNMESLPINQDSDQNQVMQLIILFFGIE